MEKEQKPKKQRGSDFVRQTALALLIFLLLTSAYSYVAEQNSTRKEIALSALAADVTKGNIEELIVRGDEIEVRYKNRDEKNPSYTFAKKEVSGTLAKTLSELGVPPEKIATTTISIKKQGGINYWLGNLAPFLLPILILALVIWFLSRQVRGAGMQAFSFGQSKARITLPHDQKQKVSFKDVAGAKEAKEELTEIVDFLKNPKKFLDIGAQIPKGVLLMGASGTGKTLLARAVAGEAGVPFFSISGSEFVEMFVGVGASRVRDLFRLAKKQAPAIIFIDEIDAVGRVRGGGIGGGNDEREQTLNQILVELDGFEPTDRLVVMAATNRPDVLDSALVRPGRFDRRVVVDPPDRADREAILAIHARGKPLFEDVNLRVIAERTPGFSGADLASLMNEGAILAARENRTKISQYDLIRSIEKVLLGPERKSHLLSKKEKEITAYHEAGHALVASVLPHADPVHKVSVISRGRAAGYTLKLPVEDRRLQSRREFLDDIAVSLGGFVAEKMLFDDLTTGSSNDLVVATALARDMVTRYGMSEKIGPVALEEGPGLSPFTSGGGSAYYSEKVSAVVDAEVACIMTEAETRASETLTRHRALLDAIAKRLVEAETIERDEFEKLLIVHGITPKQKQEL
jgi:cell division protease FtsH